MNDRRRDPGIAPVHYALRLAIDPEQQAFDGEVEITVEVTAPTASVTVDARALELQRAWIVADGAASPAPWQRVDDESIEVLAERVLAPGRHRIGFAYTGRLDGDGGLLKSESAGHVAVAALFAPIDARRAFPSFDDVRWRTPFATTIVAPSRFRVLSNTAVARSATTDGWTTHEFEETPPLPTYLVAVTVGEFDLHPAEDSARVRLAAAPGSPTAGDVVAVASRVTGWLEDFVGHPAPSPVLQHVAIPGFPGGTESFACISYNDRTLLGTEPPSPDSRRASASLIAHETAHLWFGGWVSPADWGSVWMNEAIATALEHTATAELLPGSDPWSELDAGRTRTLMLDELPSARAVEAAAAGRDEIEGMLDTFTYTKGSSIVRMMMEHLGTDGFRAVLSRHLGRGRFTTATSADFAAAIDAGPEGPGLGAVLLRWIREPGHTRVLVTEDGDGVALRLDPAWPVQRPTPVAVEVRAPGGSTRRHLLVDHAGAHVAIPGGASVVVNPSGLGFFRTAYRTRLPGLAALTGSEQSAHLDDLWQEALRGEIALQTLLDWLSSGSGHLSDAAAGAVLRLARTLRRLIGGEDWRRTVHSLGTTLPRPDLSAPGWSEHALLLHTELLRDADLGAQAAAMLAADRYHPRVGTLARAATTASTSDVPWTLVLGLPRTPATLQALALSRNPALAAAGLERCIARDVGADEIPFALEGVLAGTQHLAETWDWVQRNWPEVRSRVSKYYVPRAIRGIVECGDARLADEIDRWLAHGSSGLPEGAAAQLREQLAAYRTASATLGSGKLVG